MAELWLAEINAVLTSDTLISHLFVQAFEVFRHLCVAQSLEIKSLYILCLVESSQVVKFKVCILKHAFEMFVL